MPATEYEWVMIILMGLIAIGFFCAGKLQEQNEAFKLRVKIIELTEIIADLEGEPQPGQESYDFPICSTPIDGVLHPPQNLPPSNCRCAVTPFDLSDVPKPQGPLMKDGIVIQFPKGKK